MSAFGERVRLEATGWDTSLKHEIRTDPVAAPAGDHVVIEVEACGVCYRDLIDRAGRFPFLQLPITPGHEAVGVVVAAGPDAAWRIGDRVGTMHRDACGTCDRCASGATSLCERAAWVFGILVDGGYAEHLEAPSSALFALPRDLPATSAASLHCTFGTAYRDLVTLGALRSGERVLITGANGGVGSAAVQIAAHLGAAVVAAVRDERPGAVVRSLGAPHVVVDDGARIHDHSGKVDLALEAVGVSTFASSLRALRLGGRMIVVGNVVAEKAQLNLGYIITNGLTITGGTGATRADMDGVLRMHAERPFTIPIDRVLPLTQAEEAQRLVRAGGIHGRIVLIPSKRHGA
jgi:D-arabinose 1-dehydrogenase-like Zn-dependent alcohol dehydrogenase